MSVSVQDRVRFAYDAGFRNGGPIESLTIIVAISLCECGVGSSSGCEYGCNPDCCPPAPSCGVLQVYQPAHPGTADCASDPACCFRLGWDISNHGTSFSPWSTYNNGCFRQHLTEVRDAIAASPPPIGSAPPPPPPSPCPPGWTDQGGICTLLPPLPPGPGQSCPPGYTLSDGICLPPPSSPAPPGEPVVPLLLLLGGLGALTLWTQRRRSTGHPPALPSWLHRPERPTFTFR